ncbi:2-keto-3-deoxy-l-rhamnonate aldolase-like protein, partial [Trifolium pratense]
QHKLLADSSSPMHYSSPRIFGRVSGVCDVGLFRNSVVEDVLRFKESLVEDSSDSDREELGKNGDEKYWSE